MCSSLICCWDFYYIFYSFWDINDNYFNWPINQLRNVHNFFKYSLIHAPYAQIYYTVKNLVISFIVFWDINDNYFNWPINQLRNLQKFFKYSLIHAPYPQVYYTVKILVISFIVFEILTIITLIGQLANLGIFKKNSNIVKYMLLVLKFNIPLRFWFYLL